MDIGEMTFRDEYIKKLGALNSLRNKHVLSFQNARAEARATNPENITQVALSYERAFLHAEFADELDAQTVSMNLNIRFHEGFDAGFRAGELANEDDSAADATDPSKEFVKSWLNGVVLATADDEEGVRLFGELAINAAGELPEAEFNSDDEPVRWLVHYSQDWDTAAGVHKYRQRTTLVLETSLRPADRLLQRNHWVLVDRYDCQIGSAK